LGRATEAVVVGKGGAGDGLRDGERSVEELRVVDEEPDRPWVCVDGDGLEPLREREPPDEPELTEDEEPAASARAYGGWGGSEEAGEGVDGDEEDA